MPLGGDDDGIVVYAEREVAVAVAPVATVGATVAGMKSRCCFRLPFSLSDPSSKKAASGYPMASGKVFGNITTPPPPPNGCSVVEGLPK